MEKQICVLLVEDETSFADRLIIGLNQLNYKSIHVKTKDNAIAAVDKHDFDVILMDINLKQPDGEDNTDGLIAARHIGGQYQIPIIFLTTASTKKIVDDAYATPGMLSFLSKEDDPTLLNKNECNIPTEKGIEAIGYAIRSALKITKDQEIVIKQKVDRETSGKQRICIYLKGSTNTLEKVYLMDMTHARVEEGKLQIHVINNKRSPYIANISLAEFFKKTQHTEMFVQCHKHWAVNVSKVVEFNRTESWVKLEGNTKLKITDAYRASFYEKFETW